MAALDARHGSEVKTRATLAKGRRDGMADKPVGCARPTGGPVGGSPKGDKPATEKAVEKEVRRMVMVGQKAPDFAAPAYHKGAFTSVKLSDLLGKWVVLCCYPGDFTFV